MCPKEFFSALHVPFSFPFPARLLLGESEVHGHAALRLPQEQRDQLRGQAAAAAVTAEPFQSAVVLGRRSHGQLGARPREQRREDKNNR